MKKDNNIYLRHMLDAILRIEEYTKGVSEEIFFKKNIIQSAVTREIEIIGEAAKNIDSKFKEEYNSIPWKLMIGMRDKLIHAYFGVDLKSVWKTVKEDIPVLKKELMKML